MNLCSTHLPQDSFSGGFVGHLSLTEASQQSVTKIIPVAVINLVPPKASAERELLFNKLATVL
jgi:hypothetical protein